MSETALKESTIFSVSPIIRGWKYGLYSALPTSTKCVFRRNRFGQPRDMLEQRLFTYSTYINDNRMLIGDAISDNFEISGFDINGNTVYLSNNLPLTNGSTSSSSSIQKKYETKTEDLYPVQVRFVKQTSDVNEKGIGKIKITPVSPEETSSYNKNSYARSSTPYKEGNKIYLTDEPFTNAPNVQINTNYQLRMTSWSSSAIFYSENITGTEINQDLSNVIFSANNIEGTGTL